MVYRNIFDKITGIITKANIFPHIYYVLYGTVCLYQKRMAHYEYMYYILTKIIYIQMILDVIICLSVFIILWYIVTHFYDIMIQKIHTMASLVGFNYNFVIRDSICLWHKFKYACALLAVLKGLQVLLSIVYIAYLADILIWQFSKVFAKLCQLIFLLISALFYLHKHGMVQFMNADAVNLFHFPQNPSSRTMWNKQVQSTYANWRIQLSILFPVASILQVTALKGTCYSSSIQNSKKCLKLDAVPTVFHRLITTTRIATNHGQ